MTAKMSSLHCRVFQEISNAETVRSLLPKNGELTHTNFSTVHLSHKVIKMFIYIIIINVPPSRDSEK